MEEEWCINFHTSGNVGTATITFDRPHGFGQIKTVNTITGGSGLTNGTYHNGVKLFNSGSTTWDGASKATVASNAIAGVEIIEGGSAYTTGNLGETFIIDNSATGGSGARFLTFYCRYLN